mgnify:CR=1 FL=1
MCRSLRRGRQLQLHQIQSRIFIRHVGGGRHIERGSVLQELATKSEIRDQHTRKKLRETSVELHRIDGDFAAFEAS